MAIGIRLRKVRERYNLSQRKLAQMSGVAQSHISDIEAGRASPTLKVIERIAAALDLPVSALIEPLPGAREPRSREASN